MTISYPLTPPLGLQKQVRFAPRLRNATAVSQSPFSGEQQRYSWPFQMWTCEIELAPMSRAQGEAVEAFFTALRGRLGSFLLGPRHATGPRGTANTSGVTVNGASQTGRALAVAGLGASKTLLAGDWFQLGSGSSTRLHRVVEDATANGSGQATLSIEPALRASPVDGSTVVLASPVGIWSQAVDEFGAEIERGAVWRFQAFTLMEVL